MSRKWPVAIGLMLTVLMALAIPFHNPLRTLISLRKVDDYPLYVMDYYGDYGFEEFLRVGLETDSRSQSYNRENSPLWACTCFSALNEEGHLILGRNFDWRNRPTLMLFTDPADGYASVTMVDMSYFGFDAEGPTWFNRTPLLDAPYLPFDGMNEHGLAVGMMAVSRADGGRDPQKKTISSLQAIRLMLDYAQDVDEAIALLQHYNLDFGAGPPLHYLIADSSGNSIVVEFLAGEMNVLRNNEPWQVSTNFIISEERPEGAASSCWRYNEAYEALEQADGKISTEEAMAILKDVSQSGDYYTMWSIVYNMTTGDIRVAMGRKYDESKEFKLEMMANQ
ncbi:MAG: C45 family peptidase [Chloroflexota bacterium]|nr:C45 family peptidase [Chloroflexota bacterium]